jgi:hypothetical protein
MGSQAFEIASGNRFEFGENWRHFLKLLDPARIAAAEDSLRKMLDVRDLRERTFLDIGSGAACLVLQRVV